MLKKRGQGLSVTTIILVVLGLLILVAIVMMLSGRFGDFGKGADDQVTAGEELWETLGGDVASSSSTSSSGPSNPSGEDWNPNE